MREINLTFESFGNRVLPLGIKGENLALQVSIDCATVLTAHPTGHAALTVNPPEGEAYPGEIWMSGNTVLWQIRSRDLLEPGRGTAVLNIVDGLGTVLETVTATTVIQASVPTGILPEQIEDWLQSASVTLKETQQALLDIDTAIENAKKQSVDENVLLALERIENKKNASIAAFDSHADETAEDEIDGIQSEGATQIAAVEAKGQEVLDSIPEDYTELSGDVTDLKSALGDITGPNKNLLYYYPWLPSGAKITFVDDSIVVTATSASTYRMAYCDIPVNGKTSVTLSYVSKSSDSQTQTAALIRVGFVNDQGMNTWQAYVSKSPAVYNISGVSKVRVGLYVDQVSVSIGTKSTFHMIQVEYGDTATAFSKAKYDAVDMALQEEVDNLKSDLPAMVDDAIAGIGTNKYNPDTKVTGFINADTGTINPNADYFTSDFIDVSAFTKGYAFTPKARKLLFYDENKNAITASYHTDETPAGVISLNSAYKFIRLSWYRSSTDVMVCDATTLPPYEPYEIVAKDGVNYLNSDTKAKIQQIVGEDGKSSQIASYLNGKTVLVFGDSIMHGAGNNDNGIADLLADKYGTISADYSVSGATMGVRTDDPQYTVDEVHHIAKQVRNAIAASVSPDLIIFDGGTNDIGGSILIGTMSDVYTEPSSESYFADGFETVAYLLMKNFVGVPIIYMRAHNMSSRSYTGQMQYGELGNQIAEKWGIRTVDMYKRMNTQLAEYRTEYLADYTHPNAAGYNKYYIPAIEDFIFSELIN